MVTSTTSHLPGTDTNGVPQICGPVRTIPFGVQESTHIPNKDCIETGLPATFTSLVLQQVPLRLNSFENA
jgi:hypothetical protein